MAEKWYGFWKSYVISPEKLESLFPAEYRIWKETFEAEGLSLDQFADAYAAEKLEIIFKNGTHLIEKINDLYDAFTTYFQVPPRYSPHLFLDYHEGPIFYVEKVDPDLIDNEISTFGEEIRQKWQELRTHVTLREFLVEGVS